MKASCTGECTNQVETDITSPPLTDTPPKGGFVSQFTVPKMDCPSEERMIRLALDDLGPEIALEFDTPHRSLKVFYANNLEIIQSRIESLGLGATLDFTCTMEETLMQQCRVCEEGLRVVKHFQ